VLQMISPDTVEGASGFSPRPSPRLIASYHTHHPALSVSRGLDRDRVVDETGNQTVVFGRRGSRPFKIGEMQPFLRHKDGSPYRVEDLGPKSAIEDREVDGVKYRVGKVFTRSGRVIESPAVPVPVVPETTELVPQLDLLNIPFLPPGNLERTPPPPPAPEPPPQRIPAEPPTNLLP